MKKALIIVLFPSLIFMGFLCCLIILILGGEMETEPIPTFATPEKAEEYQYIGSELGIPWELTLMADGFLAFQEKESSIEQKNPLITSLEFCLLNEYHYTKEEKLDADGKPLTDQNGNKIYEKKLIETKKYEACDAILSYIEADRNTFHYKEVSVFVAALNEKAEKKSTGNELYEITLLSNPDNLSVLTNYIGLQEKDAQSVLQIFDAHYLAMKYGYMMPEDDDILTDAEGGMGNVDVTVGNVTREELARMASSIMNWPYLLGGKSSKIGSPSGALDCSGYVDWVYIQCFGRGVSAGGSIPSGIAVSGTAIQYYTCDPISEGELKIGDLGFLKRPSDVAAGAYNHVGIYIGEIGGRHAWIHCGGSSFGYDARPRGRVGVSVTSGTNHYNPVTNLYFEPAMKACNFKYFRRPRFQFKDDVSAAEGGT